MFKTRAILLTVVFLSVMSGHISAFTLRGVIIDKLTGDVLIGATVVVKEKPSVGAAAGLDGTFHLKDLPENEKMTLVARYLGYHVGEVVISPKTENIKIELEPQSHSLNEVVVEAKYDRSTDMGARYIERSYRNECDERPQYRDFARCNGGQCPRPHIGCNDGTGKFGRRAVCRVARYGQTV